MHLASLISLGWGGRGFILGGGILGKENLCWGGDLEVKRICAGTGRGFLLGRGIEGGGDLCWERGFEWVEESLC